MENTECHCQGLMTKRAMNINIRRGGDDYFLNRLFSYLNSELDGTIHSIKPLRGNVYLVDTQDSRFILKGYQELRKLKIQEAFTSSLRHAGFDSSYKFLRMKSILPFQGLYYGCIEYLKQQEKRFDYGTQSERDEGVALLSKFHDHSGLLVPSFTGMLPKADLARKWQHRKDEFTKNLPVVHFYVNSAVTNEILGWAEVSLSRFSALKTELEQEQPTILHGDVAHHNFLRAKGGKLYLIDFDLISIGPRAYDMLQYANRILPYLDWNFDSLKKIFYFKKWLRYESFLYGLLYPADILREWNRLVREQNPIPPIRLSPLVDMTINQFQQRKKFLADVQSELAK
ncbi:phosphotransferase [Mesobacillus subterraneus]|nr:phosphotransferase [Mesobacillus subterraneus]